MGNVNWSTIRDEEAERMTAEEKAKEAETTEKKDTGQTGEEGLFFDAQRVLGEHLYEKFREAIKQKPNCEFFFRTFAPYLFRYANDGYNRFNVQLESSIKKEILARIFSRVGTGNIKLEDIIRLNANVANIPSNSYTSIFPEGIAINSFIAQMQNGGVSLTSPYDAIMFLSPENRPLLVMATKKFEEKLVTTGVGDVKFQYRLPDTLSLVETAEKYGVKIAGEATSELNRLSF